MKGINLFLLLDDSGVERTVFRDNPADGGLEDLWDATRLHRPQD